MAYYTEISNISSTAENPDKFLAVINVENCSTTKKDFNYVNSCNKRDVLRHPYRFEHKNSIAKLEWWNSSNPSVLAPKFLSMNNQCGLQLPDQKYEFLEGKTLESVPVSIPLNTSKMHFTENGIQGDNILTHHNPSNQLLTQYHNSTLRQPSGISNNSSGSSPTCLPSKHANVIFQQQKLRNSITSTLPTYKEARCQSFLNHGANNDEDQVSQDSQLLVKGE